MNLFESRWLRHKQQSSTATLTGEAAPANSRTQSADSEESRFIARQPIFDRKRRVFGYELLARTGWENRFSGDSDAATRKMIFDGALYGFEGLTRGRKAFINCTRESLVEGMVTLLPQQTVLEVLETVAPDSVVLEACNNFKKMGYQIALDDFTLCPEIEPLVALADYIKVDFRLSNAADRREIRACLKGSKAVLVAEKIETEEEHKTASDEGFDLFQGYFFCHPTLFSANRAPASGNKYLQLFSAVSQKDLNFLQLAALVESEVTICYQLLRLVNSAAFGLTKSVESVHGALVLVGEEQFRKLVLNTIAAESCKRHPDELLIRVLQRARFFELLSPYTGENPQEQYMFGLLTLIGVMLDLPLDVAIRSMPLRDEVKRALHGEPNNVSRGLSLLRCYEQGDWMSCIEKTMPLKLTEGTLSRLYAESLRWAEQAANCDPQDTAH